MRTEFGVPRSNCSCVNCQTNCRFMPGFLIPADLDRMIPAGADPLDWAERNLLASPGALVSKGGHVVRIHTLVPAIKPDGSCINLADEGLCRIHETSPFGCAFFSCGPEVPNLANSGIIACALAGPESLYWRIWAHLDSIGRRQHAPEALRKRMAEAMLSEAEACAATLRRQGWTQDDFAKALRQELES